MARIQGRRQAGRGDRNAPSTSDFLPLIKEVMRVNKVKQLELAEQTGIKQDMLSRYLSGKVEMSFGTVFIIANQLGIDRLRAYISVICLGDWKLYFDERVITTTEFSSAVIEEGMKQSTLSVPWAESRQLAAVSVQSLAERRLSAGFFRNENGAGFKSSQTRERLNV